MTVGELIAELQKMPAERQVLVAGIDDGYAGIEKVVAEQVETLHEVIDAVVVWPK